MKYTVYCVSRGCFKIDKHLARYFVYYGKFLSNPPSFLCSQIITSILNSIISTNHDKGFEFQLIVKPLYPALILSLVQNLFCEYVYTEWIILCTSITNVNKVDLCVQTSTQELGTQSLIIIKLAALNNSSFQFFFYTINIHRKFYYECGS